MQTVVRPDISCKDCAETTSLILKKLGQPVMTNLYYNTIKILLERVSSVMVDSQGIKVSFVFKIELKLFLFFSFFVFFVPKLFN